MKAFVTGITGAAWCVHCKDQRHTKRMKTFNHPAEALHYSHDIARRHANLKVSVHDTKR